MSWATGVMRGKDNTPPTAAFPVIPKRRDQRRRAAMRDGKRTIVEEPVISALNARSWQSGRINEGMTPKQCHVANCNSQQVEGNAGWDRHSSGDLRN